MLLTTGLDPQSERQVLWISVLPSEQEIYGSYTGRVDSARTDWCSVDHHDDHTGLEAARRLCWLYCQYSCILTVPALFDILSV